MRAATRRITLALRHPFGISRGTVDALPTVLTALVDDDDQVIGIGEAAPVRYLGQRVDAIEAAIPRLAAAIDGDLDDPAAVSARLGRVPAPSAARAAVDLALWDAAARRRGAPLHRLLGAPAPGGVTSYTIALDDLEAMEARAREAADLPILKVKLGRDPDFDRAALDRIAAAAPRARLRIDANGGWSPDLAPAMITACAAIGERRGVVIEMIEAPLPRGALDQLRTLRRGSPLPIFADEDALDVSDLEGLHGAVDGINIKLAKCGGLTGALAMIAWARAEGWSILLGCMIESRIGLAAACHLTGLVDAIDLDAHLLTADDPVAPGSATVLDAAIPWIEGPGLGPAPPLPGDERPV
ncbi:MAG: dipeptide epimerase [Nannocystaceae bacterium]